MRIYVLRSVGFFGATACRLPGLEKQLECIGGPMMTVPAQKPASALRPKQVGLPIANHLLDCLAICQVLAENFLRQGRQFRITGKAQ